jgi:putative transcriptional regulator
MKNRLKVARAEMNITQGELAERIGVTRQAVNSIELGKYVPSTVLALKMAKLFRKSVEELFMLEEDD